MTWTTKPIDVGLYHYKGCAEESAARSRWSNVPHSCRAPIPQEMETRFREATVDATGPSVVRHGVAVHTDHGKKKREDEERSA
ncbi:MAG: hypothetical protein AAFQ82_26570 [Myxococcota bacterium]